MNEYNRMYHKTSFLLKELASRDSSFGRAFICGELSPKEEELIIALLKKTIGVSDGTDGDTGSAPLTLIELLDSSYKDKDKLIADIKERVIPECTGKTRDFFERLIKALEEYVKDKEQPSDEYDNELATSLCFPYSPSEGDQAIARRLLQLREFAFNKQKDPSYFPTTEPVIDTSKFNSLSRNEIAQLFNKDKFYSMSKQDVQALLQAAVNNYLAENNVPPCAVVFEDLPLGNGAVTFGEYDPNRGVIVINSKVLDLYDTAKDQDNQSFAYQLLSTAIHEARHRIQFSNFDKNNLSPKDQVVVNALKNPDLRKSHGDYLASPEELDARDAALQYMKECGLQLNDPSLMAYYNLRLNDEQNNHKSKVDSSVEQLFATIYSGKKLQTPVNLTQDSNNFKSRLFSSSELSR